MGEQIHKRLAKQFVVDVLESFNEHRMSELQACELLGIERAWLHRLRRKWLKSGRDLEKFSLYNRKTYPNFHLPEKVQNFLHKELSYINDEAKQFRQKFNFEFLSERIHQKFGIKYHRNTIRRWALRKGYYTGSREETRKVYTRFEMAGPGELYQHDSSHHIWLPLTKRYQDLILTEDDYARLIVGGMLVERETSWKHLCVAKGSIEKYGLPLVYYVDQHSTFRFCQHEGLHVVYKKQQNEAETQFGRALRSFGIGLRYTPKGEGEAKGKIEKRFDYFQRRLPYLCEKYRVTSVKEGNRILHQDLIPYYNECHIHEETQEIPIERWKRAIKEGKSRLRPIPQGAKLDLIFSLQYPRLVRKDGTIQFHGKFWKVGKYVGQVVTVCLIPQKKIVILKNNKKLWEHRI